LGEDKNYDENETKEISQSNAPNTSRKTKKKKD
jgi:hypothetical protein